MEGVIRQLYDYDGSNMFPRTRPDAFVSSLQDSDNTGIETIGELIDSSTPGTYIQDGETVDYEPEFVYRIPVSDVENLGGTDASGTLKAVKLTQVKALHFNAILSQSFTVENPVGDATLGKVYPAGTLLETIIIDILSGGNIYDVGKVLPGVSFTVQYTKDGLNYYSIPNGSTIEINSTDDMKIKYQFVFTDGKYIPVTGYSIEQFQANNDKPENTGYYIDLGVDSYLAAGSTPTLLSLKQAGSTIDSRQNPTADTIYGPIGLVNPTVGSSKLYIITLNYSAAVSTPYKSDSTQSTNRINASTCADVFTFTVQSVQTEVYDVVARSPLDIGGVQATGFNFNSRLYAINDYDFINNTSTGLWSDDGLKIGLTKYFDNTVTPADYLRHDQGGDDSSVYGPVFDVLSTGRFIPSAGYQNSTFISNNAGNVIESGTPFVVAGCNYTQPVSIKLMNENSAVSTKTISYGNDSQSMMKKRSVVTSNLTVGYYAALEYYNNPIFDLANGVAAGTYMLKAILPYTASAVTAKKSDNTNSSVVISIGNIEVNSSTFTINEEVDVSAFLPTVEILDISINGRSYSNGSTIPYNEIDAQKPAAIRFKYTDGKYKSSNISKYSNSLFENNNPGASDGSVYAECEPNGDFYLYLDETNTGRHTGISGDIATINYPLTNIGSGSKVFTIEGNYLAGEYIPKKKSTRPSSRVIGANSVSSDKFTLVFSVPTALALRVNANPSVGGNVQINDGTPNYSVTQDILPGTTVRLSASPNTGYTFKQWQSNNASISTSSHNPYDIVMPNGNTIVEALFEQATDDYHFVMVTTKDASLGSTTYNTVDELLDSTHLKQSHFNDTKNSLETLYTNTSSNSGVGSGRSVFVIAAPVEYTSAKIYVGGSDQGLTFTLVPTADSMNGIPYSTGGTVKYRLFKYRCTTTSGYNIDKVELRQ